MGEAVSWEPRANIRTIVHAFPLHARILPTCKFPPRNPRNKKTQRNKKTLFHSTHEYSHQTWDENHQLEWINPCRSLLIWSTCKICVYCLWNWPCLTKFDQGILAQGLTPRKLAFNWLLKNTRLEERSDSFHHEVKCDCWWFRLVLPSQCYPLFCPQGVYVKIFYFLLLSKSEAFFTEDWGLRTEDWGLRTDDWRLMTDDWVLKTEDWGLRTEDSLTPPGDTLADLKNAAGLRQSLASLPQVVPALFLTFDIWHKSVNNFSIYQFNLQAGPA